MTTHTDERHGGRRHGGQTGRNARRNREGREALLAVRQRELFAASQRLAIASRRIDRGLYSMTPELREVWLQAIDRVAEAMHACDSHGGECDE
jgi:hypothetical protein